ncbi:hypothetical protein P7L78_18785 [Tistrella bauzanensis]|jgi:Ca2+-binding RTX toxin-like protein|uniref:Calcium-binding protein n=1 Tax=Tistrella arctica TaxID=3133430 RepID=A0ABU9YD32_9PROT
MGGNGVDELFGTTGSDVIWGLAGDDKLFGGKGNDTREGGSGRDVVDAGAGDDVIPIAAAAQSSLTIIGGGGTDTVQLVGGVVFDSFSMTATSDVELLDVTSSVLTAPILPMISF